MSERIHILRVLRGFVTRRARELQAWQPRDGMSESELDDAALAIKLRVDEARIYLSEIDRMIQAEEDAEQR